MLQGRGEIYSTLERMVRSAQSEMQAITTHRAAVSMADMSGILDVAVARAREGLRLRTALHTTAEVRRRLAALPSHRNMEYRHYETDRVLRFVIVDDRELLMWVVNDPSARINAGDDVAIWTDAPDFVGTQSALFESVWEDADEIPQAASPGNADAGEDAAVPGDSRLGGRARSN